MLITSNPCTIFYCYFLFTVAPTSPDIIPKTPSPPPKSAERPVSKFTAPHPSVSPGIPFTKFAPDVPTLSSVLKRKGRKEAEATKKPTEAASKPTSKTLKKHRGKYANL